MAKIYESPMGDIKKALRKIADDTKDPNREAARKALRALGDDDRPEASAEDDAEDATRPKGMPPAAQQATRLSPYAAMLDEAMGLAAPKGVRSEGTQLILSSGGFKVKP